MGKVISATTLRTQLSGLLDALKNGQTHFIIERNNEEVAVLLSMEKFQDIMQTLELLNNLEYINTEGLEAALQAQEASPEFLELEPLPPAEPAPVVARPGASARSNGESVESAAARLGIRVIK